MVLITVFIIFLLIIACAFFIILSIWEFEGDNPGNAAFYIFVALIDSIVVIMEIKELINTQ